VDPVQEAHGKGTWSGFRGYLRGAHELRVRARGAQGESGGGFNFQAAPSREEEVQGEAAEGGAARAGAYAGDEALHFPVRDELLKQPCRGG